MQSHPNIFVPKLKEIHYFSLHYHKPFKWYQSFFEESKDSQAIGEVTPYYLFHPLVPQRIASKIQNIKILILLRDPIERLLSHYFHNVRLGLESLPLDEALRKETVRLQGSNQRLCRGEPCTFHQHFSYFSRSEYIPQLKRYQNSFSRHQLHIIKSEDFFVHPKQSWIDIQEFLGVSVNQEVPKIHAYAGLGESKQIDPEVRLQLRSALQATYLEMAQHYGFHWL